MKKFQKIIQHSLVALAGIVFIGSSFFGLAAAQTATDEVANGFRISPVRSELTIEKGKSDTITVTIENTTAVPTTAQPVINDFVASDKEDGSPRLILDENAPAPKNSFKSLVQPFSSVDLGPKEKKDISVSVEVPENATAGGYYGAIRFFPSSVGSTSTVGLTASVGTIVLVRVPGNLTEKLDLVQLSASQNGNTKSFMTSGDVDVLVRLKNSGDIHVQPFGKVIVKNMLGKQVYDYELNNTTPRSNVLPDSTRKFEDKIGSKLIFGRYTIEVNFGYSQGGGQLISQKTTFWYMPAWAIIGLIVIVLGVVGLVYWLMRKQKSRKTHKHDVNKQ